LRRISVKSLYSFVILFAAPVLVFGATFLESGEQKMQPAKTLTDFAGPDEDLQWRIVNDGVMGGLSQSSFEITADGTGVFKGEVSLENRGGFASVRSFPAALSLNNYSGLRLRVRGDGKTYRLRLRTDDRWDGVVYDASFQTQADRWIEVDVSFARFVPRFRGRRVTQAPALEPSNIQQVGFLISDKQEGPFRLEVDWIKAFSSQSK
jgi:monofunctional biosynthetic peptidoglycan transglycosylase